MLIAYLIYAILPFAALVFLLQKGLIAPASVPVGALKGFAAVGALSVIVAIIIFANAAGIGPSEG